MEDLLSLPSEQYLPPPDLLSSEPYQEFLDRVLLSTSEQGCFGRQLLDSGTFPLERGWTFLNHGAFGLAAKGVLEAAAAWRRYAERQPLRFFDRQLLPHLVRVLHIFRAEIGAESAKDLVLVPCATQGLNAVLQSVGRRMRTGDVIYTLDVGYGAVKKMVTEVCARADGVHEEQSVELHAVAEISSLTATNMRSSIVELVERTLDPTKTKLAVFDAVTSNTALVLPLRELIQVCHARGVPVLIDGAHALGQLPVNVTELDADYFVGNCHKWYCSLRGAAFLWVNPKRRDTTAPVPRPLTISHGFGSGFSSEFLWDGNRDYSSWLVLDVAVEFWKRLGPGLEPVRKYCHELLCEGVGYLTKTWMTRTLVPLEMCGSMTLVKLPSGVSQGAMALLSQKAKLSDMTGAVTEEDRLSGCEVLTSAHAKAVQDCLHLVYRIEVPVKCVGRSLWVRVSVAAYNEMQDFVALANAVEKIRNKQRAVEF